MLWILGFARGEYITYMLKRQSSRLGGLWWLFIALTISGITVIMDKCLTALLFTILLFPVHFLIILLVWHVVITPAKE
jgi:hypothetical protein